MGTDVTMRVGATWRLVAGLSCALVLNAGRSRAQEERGRSIGTVSTTGDLVVLQLDSGVLGRPNLFDLNGRTLRFTPAGSGYRIEHRPLRWDPLFGPRLAGAEVTLRRFAFPFSGARWRTFRVGASGSIRFAAAGEPVGLDPYGLADGGVILGRFDALADAATTLVDGAPVICVFLKPRLTGVRYVRELRDRVVVTWDLSEPYGSPLDFGWFPTVNRFQAVLHRDGVIELSYQHVAARDAIVGIYPRPSGTGRLLASIDGGAPSPGRGPLAVRRVHLSVRAGMLLRVTFETNGRVPPDGERAIVGIGYHVDSSVPDRAAPAAAWAVRGMLDPYNPAGGPPYWRVSGPGLSPRVTVAGDSLTVEGILPPGVPAGDDVAVSATVTSGDSIVQQVPPRTVRFAGVRSPAVHLAALTSRDPPLPLAFEAFHYRASPRAEDLACTVIGALGDRFDFLAYYSDFRIDSQEASSPSFGPAAGAVGGIGRTQGDLESYCSGGRFQWAFAQPIYVGSNEMQPGPPDGAPVGSAHDITYYLPRLAEASPDGRPRPYDYAVGHLGHEMAHRWAAYVSARVAGRTMPLGPWPHWDRGLQAPVAFPYELPTEASTLGGGVWQDNFDGTFTRLRDGWFVPATGYSYLDLYLMGFIDAAEVPDFFLLQNLAVVGKDTLGHLVFRADRTKITIQDVIAAEGPRVPDAAHSQRKFNTGIVVLVESGKTPSPELLERAEGIRRQWIEYWGTVTGRRSAMTASPQ